MMKSDFTVERENNQFKIVVKGILSLGWFRDTTANRKAMLVLLRELKDPQTNRRMLTLEQLAEVVESNNRQAADSHLKGYRDADNDILTYLKHKCKVDDAVIDVVLKIFLKNPYASSLKELRDDAAVPDTT